MLISKEILFESGKILNAEMLNELKKKSLIFFKIKYYSYCDGIINGLNFESDDNNLYLTPGILKHKEEYYFLEKKIKIMNFTEKGGSKYIYLKLNEEIFEEDNIKTKKFEINICDHKQNEDFIYLGYFEHHENKVISTIYDTFEDLGHFGTNISILERKYSGVSGQTISPEIIYQYAKKLLKNDENSSIENYFINRGLNKEIVEIDILKNYFGNFDSFLELYEMMKNKKIKTNRNLKKSLDFVID